MPEKDYNDPLTWADENVMKEFLKYNGTLLYNHVDCIFNDSIKEVQVSILG